MIGSHWWAGEGACPGTELLYVRRELLLHAVFCLERCQRVLYAQGASFDYEGPPLSDTTLVLIAELREAAQ